MVKELTKNDTLEFVGKWFIRIFIPIFAIFINLKADQIKTKTLEEASLKFISKDQFDAIKEKITTQEATAKAQDLILKNQEISVARLTTSMDNLIKTMEEVKQELRELRREISNKNLASSTK